MPYTGANDTELPEYISKLPPAIRARWVAIFNSVLKTNGETMAFLVANKWLKRAASARGGKIVARTYQVERLKLELDNSKELIVRTENGEEYVSFKLADVFRDKFGVKLPEFLLRTWEGAINSGKVILGDVDHEEYQRLLEEGHSEEEIKERLKEKPSIAKAVKAVFDGGKLFVKAIIDKRYKRLIEKSKGVSMEALVLRDEQGNVVGGDLIGFTFGVKQDPVISGTEVRMVAA